MNIHSVIFAGGSGTRLWPLSRKNSPKQMKPFLDDETLLQKTYNRVVGIVGKDNIYISTNINLKTSISHQIDCENMILEPDKKDTAAAIGYACVKVLKKNKNAIMTNIWSDHFIKNQKEYAKLFRTAEKFLESHQESIFMAGVKPSYPETGYGYIQVGNIKETCLGQEIFNVKSFKEKPDLDTAKSYMLKPEYLWNPGMLFFRVDYMLNLYKEHMPEMYKGLMEIHNSLGTEEEDEITKKSFDSFEQTSIDYAILERTKELYLIQVDLGWTDVGNWKAVYDILNNGEKNIVKNAKYIEVDSNNNLIFSQSSQLISTVGINDMLVVVSEDVIMLCSKERAQNIKELVQVLQANPEMTQYL